MEGILWVQLVNKSDTRIKWNLCVCYLPPHGTSRPVDASDFFEELNTQIYRYQNDGEFMLMGDFNSRLGDRQDFIEGVDEMPERETIDTKENVYSDLFLEFLISSNCVMLNGRSNVRNDFTYVSTRGLSVVDYAIVPHSMLQYYSDFEVVSTKSLFTAAGCNGIVDPERANIPDHSVLKWSVQVSSQVFIEEDDKEKHNPLLPSPDHVIYNFKHIPPTYMTEDVIIQVQDVIQRLEQQESNQLTIDFAYDAFINLIEEEMKDKIDHKSRPSQSQRHHKQNRRNKPWWHAGLSKLWADLVQAEKEWTQACTGQKARYKAIMRGAQQKFNREVQKTKRRYWYNQQVDLATLCDQDQVNFWKKIGKIGIVQERKRRIPLEIVRPDGSVCTDTDAVKQKWQADFCTLLNPVAAIDRVPDTELPAYPIPVNESEDLNVDISYDEVVEALKKVKSGKAVGIDKLPVEALKNATCAMFMTHLFNACFKSNCVPEIWGKGIISPIVKDSTKDLRDPGNYRGLNIAPAMYKLYCSVINNRLCNYIEVNDYLADEQNGFQKGKSTTDHLITLTNVLETRKMQRKETFVAYIDFSKAYDRINRCLLWKKLETLGIKGNMLNCIKSLYANVTGCVKLGPTILTDWFRVGTGLRQGCILSPLLFNIYLNDLITEVKTKCKGISIDDEKLCILAYADDIALVAENEEDLQSMLNIVQKWCTTWDVIVNTHKSQIVHFRAKSTPETRYEFIMSGKELAKVEKYKYLGLVIDYKLDFKVTAESVAKSANRALGLLIAKSKACGGLPYNCFSKLYESMVIPIIMYGASVWGHKQYSCINAVHNRLCRYFLGVGKFTPNAAVQGDMGLKVPWQYQRVEMCRMWCRLVNMSEDRLNKRMFLKCNDVNVRNWNYRVREYLASIDQNDYVDVGNSINKETFLNEIRECTERENEVQWLKEVNKINSKSGKGKNKLRTYNTFKFEFTSEPYVYTTMSKSSRSAYAQFRCGTAPIKLETGRYEGLALEARICPLCKSGIEDERHVLFECPVYNNIRTELFQQLACYYPNIHVLSKREMLKCILACKSEGCVRLCAKACNSILQLRKQFLYK